MATTHNSDIELIAKNDDNQNDNVSKLMHDNIHKDITWSQILGGSIGNILEWYDFGIFGLLAPEIGYNFFPSSSNNHAVELLKAFGVFAGAFVMRPVGGLIFGVLGDRTGRKSALQISMILMFIATFSIGCLPKHSTIGIWAPILLTILRLFQGVSVGGQLVGSILFIVESARNDKRGFYGALAMMTAVSGGLFATWAISIMKAIFSADEMNAYAWRIPFLSSFVIAVFGFISQRTMEQSHEFVHASKHNKILSNPLKTAIQKHWKEIIVITIVVVPWCQVGYMTFTWLPTYLESQVGVNNAFLISTFLIVFNCVILLVGGKIADKWNYYIPMKMGIIILMVWSIPSYYLMYKMMIINDSKGIWTFVLADFGMAIGLGLLGGPMQLFMVDSVDDVVVRYSVIGISYNLSQAFFGGTAPLVGSALALYNFVYVGVYLSVFCALATITIFIWTKSKFNKQQKDGYYFDKIDL